MSVTGDRIWESWKFPRITMRQRDKIAIETMVPSELPSAAPSTPGLCRTGIFTLTLATALLSTVAKIAVTTRMARAARTLSPRSEERRVGKEGKYRSRQAHDKKKENKMEKQTSSKNDSRCRKRTC